MKRALCSILGLCSALSVPPAALHAQRSPVTTSVTPGTDPSTRVIQFTGPDGTANRVEVTSTGRVVNVQAAGPDGAMQDVALTDAERSQLAAQIMSSATKLPEDLVGKLLDGRTDLTADEQEQLTNQIADGMKNLPEGLKDKLLGDQKDAIEKALRDAQSSDTSTALQRLLGKNGKAPVIVLDSVRAGEKDLKAFARSLREGKVRLRPNGVRKLTGDAPEAKQYGAGPGDEVIILSTEPAGQQH